MRDASGAGCRVLVSARSDVCVCVGAPGKFVAVEREIELISPLHNIGALSLNTKNLKLQLRNECRSWKVQYSDKVHNQAREQMLALFEYMRSTQAQLKRDVDSIDSLRSVMAVLREVRERESSIEMEIMPILDMYQMLEEFLPGGVMEKEEMDQRSVLRSHWVRLVDFAEEVTDRLSEVQGTFKHKLTRDVREFLGDVSRFRAEFIKSGPMVPGITPAAAVERLNRFKSEFTDLERKREIYTAGEQLFALRTTKYPDLDRTKREVALLDTLYSLYLEVVKVMDGYRQLTWSSAVNTLPTLVEKVSSFDTRCRRLPKKLREWDAYKELRQTVSDFQDVLPLLQQLSQDCMKQRHWAAIMSATGKTFNMEGDLFKLSTLLDANLLEHKEDVEDVCESAVKQAQIETKLTDIKLLWSVTEFNFSTWSGRDVPILDKYGEIMESLEESQLSLQTMLSMRHVAPFKNDAQSTLSLLSDTSDTLELWLKVQLLWTSLESVFTGGDIAKQMPLEAKKFAKIDKDFSKLMLKAEDTRLVVPCCTYVSAVCCAGSHYPHVLIAHVAWRVWAETNCSATRCRCCSTSLRSARKVLKATWSRSVGRSPVSISSPTQYSSRFCRRAATRCPSRSTTKRSLTASTASPTTRRM